MRKFIFSISLAALLTCIASCTRHNPPSHASRQKKVQAAVNKIRESYSDSIGMPFPSINVLIQTPDDKIFVSSRAASAQIVTEDTYYRFASNTKNFTSAAILNMYEDGWLDYKAKITDLVPTGKIPYVPATPDWDFPYKNDITIEQLLQHAAGVFDVDNDPVPGYNGLSYTEFIQNADPAHQFNTEEMIKVLREKNLFYYAPGTAHHYSNTGYSILSEIIKRVYSFRAGTEKSYADYMEDYIIGDHTPVPLKTVHFPVLASDIAMPDPFLIGTVYEPGSIEKYGDYNMSGQVGEGNGYGTMADLNKYIRTMMKGQNVLNDSTVHLMQRSFAPGDLRYALGCTLTPNLGYGHNGARIGYLSLMAYDPVYDISVVSMIPIWDLRNGSVSFTKTFTSIYDAAYAARQALGYPGKP
jgi:D-alanyl-D-alanine carboxypeptidase